MAAGMGKNFVYACCLVLISIAASICLLEVGYRLQIIDFYKPELDSYNRPADFRTPRMTKTVLILGDSFGADAYDAYPVNLRRALPNFRIINSSIRGIGSLEAGLVAPHRFSQFNPDIFVYQIYVGNDLFDIRYPTNYAKTNLTRWAYWSIANYLRVIAFLNYRLGQISSLKGLMNRFQGERTTFSAADLVAPFSKELHSHRERMIFLAEPKLLDETINLKGRRGQDFLKLVKNLRYIVEFCHPARCQAFVLVIPHKVQVSREYIGQYEILGATFADKDTLINVDYPFVRTIEAHLADRKNLLILNPLSSIQKIERGGIKLYFANDEHMNPEGQKLLADVLLKAMASRMK
jgi:hypothetical protein